MLPLPPYTWCYNGPLGSQTEHSTILLFAREMQRFPQASCLFACMAMIASKTCFLW